MFPIFGCPQLVCPAGNIFESLNKYGLAPNWINLKKLKNMLLFL